MEVLNTSTSWCGPGMQRKLEAEYVFFQYSAALIFLAFLASMLVLAGRSGRREATGWIRPLKSRRSVEMPERPLAVVTGASSGIGTMFARKLAQRGYDLLLIARREDRLRSLASELSEAYHISAEPLTQIW